MDSLAFHRDALDVAQHVIDAVRNPNTYADEKEPNVGASAADRFAAFAGRWT